MNAISLRELYRNAIFTTFKYLVFRLFFPLSTTSIDRTKLITTNELLPRKSKQKSIYEDDCIYIFHNIGNVRRATTSIKPNTIGRS